MTAKWPMPPDAAFTPDFHNDLQIFVDTQNVVAERSDRNNLVAFTGTTLG